MTKPPKYKQGQFVQLGSLKIMRGKVLQIFPGFRKNEYLVIWVSDKGRTSKVVEKVLKVAPEQKWLD
jgi:hypothetical protein